MHTNLQQQFGERTERMWKAHLGSHTHPCHKSTTTNGPHNGIQIWDLDSKCTVSYGIPCKTQKYQMQVEVQNELTADIAKISNATELKEN